MRRGLYDLVMLALWSFTAGIWLMRSITDSLPATVIFIGCAGMACLRLHSALLRLAESPEA